MPDLGATPAVPPSSADSSAEYEYDAFFSYTTGADAKVVRRTERYLEEFHRQWLLRRLHLQPLRICVDGSDIRPRAGDAVESVDDTLRRYLARSRHLVVFCSPAAARSAYVDLEIRAFLEDHPPGTVLPVVTSGDPSVDPAAVFPKALVERGYHQAIWLDFRGAAAAWARPRARIRPFKEERVKLAAELHGRGPDLLPAWRKAQVIRRRLTTAAAACVALLAVTTGTLGLRASAQAVARQIEGAIAQGSDEPIDALRSRAVLAVSRWHDQETDEAYRLAAALLLHLGAPRASTGGPWVLSADSHAAARLADGRLEVTDDVRRDAWRSVSNGPFTGVDISDDGRTVAAVGPGSWEVWRDGSVSRCVGPATAAAGRAVAVDPTGARVAGLFGSDDGWSVVVTRANDCGRDAVLSAPLWSATEPGIAGNLSAEDDDSLHLELGPGGQSLVVASSGRWLLATLHSDAESTIEPLNPLLDESAQGDRVDGAPDSAGVVVASDWAFSGDGRYAAIGLRWKGTLSGGNHPRALLVPLQGTGRPVPIPDSRGTRRLTWAGGGNVIAFAVDSVVRTWTREEARSARLDRRDATVSALAFVAADDLLLIADLKEPSSMTVLDAESGARLGDVEMRGRVSSIAPGGTGGRTALLRVDRLDGGADAFDLVELRPPGLGSRVRKLGDDGRLEPGVFLGAGAVALGSPAGTLRIARAGHDGFEEVGLGSPIEQLAASGKGVLALLTNGRLLTCAATTCEATDAVDHGVRSVATDPSGTVWLGCADGTIVARPAACDGARATSAVEETPARVLAASAAGIVAMKEDAPCVAPTRAPDRCEALPADVTGVVAGAMSSNGAFVALAFEGKGVEIFRRRAPQWVPWLGRRFARQSEIPEEQTILGMAFSPDGSWLRTASDWNSEIVLRCIPVTATAMREAECPDD